MQLHSPLHPVFKRFLIFQIILNKKYLDLKLIYLSSKEAHSIQEKENIYLSTLVSMDSFLSSCMKAALLLQVCAGLRFH